MKNYLLILLLVLSNMVFSQRTTLKLNDALVFKKDGIYHSFAIETAGKFSVIHDTSLEQSKRNKYEKIHWDMVYFYHDSLKFTVWVYGNDEISTYDDTLNGYKVMKIDTINGIICKEYLSFTKNYIIEFSKMYDSYKLNIDLISKERFSNEFIEKYCNYFYDRIKYMSMCSE